MPAPVVGSRREGFQPRDEATHFHFVMSDFAPSNDQHTMPLQGRGKSRIYPAEFPANSGSMLQGGGIRNSDNRTADVATYSYGKGKFQSQTLKNDVVTAPLPMSAEAAGLFAADAYAGISDIIRSSQEGDTVRSQDEQRNRGSDPFLLDLPDLGGFGDFEADLSSAFENENYFDDPMWPSICSPDVQLVPSSRFDSDANSSSADANPILESTLSVPDTADQINMANPMNTQQPCKNKGRKTPSSDGSSSQEIEHLPRLSDAELFFCPFDDMLVPISPPSVLRSDEIVPSSSATRSGPGDLVSAYVPPRRSAKKKPHVMATPDMILDEMAGNPLEMYFPPLTMYDQPQLPMSGASSTVQMHHQLLPGSFAGQGALNSSGLEFGPRGTRTSGGGLRENPRSPSTVRPKRLGFQKLQEGMNQLDVGTKTCIRDALYRLANNVEQRHCVDLTVGSSDADRLTKPSSVLTETQGSPMDRSVAQLLLQKPLHQQKATDRQGKIYVNVV